MNKSYTVMELEAIKHLCKCVNSVANLPADLIADTNVATNTTYSSYRINAEMSALENDIQRYVDTALAGLSRLTKEVIDDKALVVKENVLYLYKDPSDMNNDYMQMMLINGVAIELGSTTCDFSSVYSKDEIDDKFALKIDLDVLTTSFNNLVASVDNKIDKDKIVTVLDDSVTDEQVPSAKVVYEELDKKIEGDNVVKKDDIVTILNNTVTDEDIPSAKAVYDKVSSIMSTSSTSYSTSEQLTGGTWIDGKPIYRKTVVCGALPNSTLKYMEHGIDNIGWVIAMYGSAYSDPFTFIPLPFPCTIVSYTLEVACNKTSVAFKTGSDLSSYKESYVTIEYTKTTD